MGDPLARFNDMMRGRRVTVIGIGVSNMPVIRMLCAAGAVVTACDKLAGEQLGDAEQELEALGVSLRLGDDYLEGIDADIVIKTPGMRFDLPELERARRRGSEVTSEIQLFLELCPCKTIGVTGSDGKSTTASLIHEMITAQGLKSHLGGNIGRPLLQDIGVIKPGDIAVLELSSFQLHTVLRSPDIAVVTNVTPNHLDVHTSMEEYIDAKRNIYNFQGEGGRLVVGADNDTARAMGEDAAGELLMFSMEREVENGAYWRDGMMFETSRGPKPLLYKRDLALPGDHNIQNYMAAVCAVRGIAGDRAIREAAASFRGLPHRLELVRESGGVRYYNDSIASSPARTMAGLKCFDRRIILIAGGYDKRIPFDELGQAICERTKLVLLIGATAPRIEEAIESAPGYVQGAPAIVRCESMSEAVTRAAKAAAPGDDIVLSPACASFDMYKNFEERGNSFKTIVSLL